MAEAAPAARPRTAPAAATARTDDLAPFRLALTTRGYELDVTGTVGMPIIFRYFELKRWEMMRDPRLGLIEHVHAGHFFVVREQTIAIRRRVGQGVPLTIVTTLGRVGRSSASVRHALTRVDDGALVAEAAVTGVWIGPNRRMARIPDSLRRFARAHQAEHQDPATGPSAATPVRAPASSASASFFDPPRTVHPRLDVAARAGTEPPPQDAFAIDIQVPPRDLDVFSHVNAATWLSYCDDARIYAARAGALPSDAGEQAFNVRSALFYPNEATVDTALRVSAWAAPAEVPGVHAIRCAVARAHDGEVLCRARIDVQPGATPISPARTPG